MNDFKILVFHHSNCSWFSAHSCWRCLLFLTTYHLILFQSMTLNNTALWVLLYQSLTVSSFLISFVLWHHCDVLLLALVLSGQEGRVEIVSHNWVTLHIYSQFLMFCSLCFFALFLSVSDVWHVNRFVVNLLSRMFSLGVWVTCVDSCVPSLYVGFSFYCKIFLFLLITLMQLCVADLSNEILYIPSRSPRSTANCFLLFLRHSLRKRGSSFLCCSQSTNPWWSWC